MTELDDQKMGNRTRNKKRLIMVALMMLFWRRSLQDGSGNQIVSEIGEI